MPFYSDDILQAQSKEHAGEKDEEHDYRYAGLLFPAHFTAAGALRDELRPVADSCEDISVKHIVADVVLGTVSY